MAHETSGAGVLLVVVIAATPAATSAWLGTLVSLAISHGPETWAAIEGSGGLFEGFPGAPVQLGILAVIDEHPWRACRRHRRQRLRRVEREHEERLIPRTRLRPQPLSVENSALATRTAGLVIALASVAIESHNREPSHPVPFPHGFFRSQKNVGVVSHAGVHSVFRGEVTWIGFAFASRRLSSEDVWRPGLPPRRKAHRRVRGRVTDQQAGALPGVTVTVTNQDTGTFAKR